MLQLFPINTYNRAYNKDDQKQILININQIAHVVLDAGEYIFKDYCDFVENHVILNMSNGDIIHIPQEEWVRFCNETEFYKDEL